MPVTIAPFYAALLGLLLIVLTARVVAARQRYRVGIGDGGHIELRREIRVHGNFVEYVPLTLVLLALMELNGAPAAALHGLGAGLLLGRVLHAWGLSRSSEASFGRLTGALLTWLVLIVSALWLLWLVAPALATPGG